jgi:hypothetical protein
MKKLALAVGLALWAWLGVEGLAEAQATKAMSCDANEGTPCATGSNLICNSGGTWGGFECTIWYDAGSPPGTEAAPNRNECGHSPPATITCASDHCLPGSMNHQTRYGDAGTCCAGPGQALASYSLGTECLDTNQTYAGLFSQFPAYPHASTLGCYLPGHYVDGHWMPSDIYFFDGGLVCANNYEQDYDYAQTFVDAGLGPYGSQLGGLYHLMRSDATLWDAGIVIVEPLGFLPIEDAPGNYSQPNYVCQMPEENNYTGSWLLEYVGSTSVDLTECSPDGQFPCCGSQRDAGPGQPNLCQQDVRGVYHCACITDGNSCDVPRKLTTNPFDTGECCSPGLSTQIWDPLSPIYDGGTSPILYAGEGWCRSAAGVDPTNGGSSAAYAPGFCNCLPDSLTCSTDSDCCSNSIIPADGGHGACNHGSGKCGCSGAGGTCASAHDCCGGYVCFDAGTHNFCT